MVVRKMKRIRVRKKLHKFILTVLFVFLVFFIWQTFEIIAKYYTRQNNKGVAVASGLYFNSDKLKKIPGAVNPIIKADSQIAAIDNITDDEISKIMISTNTASWSSGSVELPLKIQNYDSNILFNDSGLDISYRIEFKLLDEPIGATYEIIGKNNISNDLIQKNSTCQYEGKLVGGSLQADSYQLKITLSDKDAYKAARVLVLAYPVSPDYLVNNENQQFRLLGVFEGHTNEMKLEIESAAFLVEKDIYEDSTNLKSVLNNSVAYIYNIKTTGDMVQNTSSATKREIVVKWRSEYLSLDQYNEYYKEAMKNSVSFGNEIIDGNEWKYIKIKVLPYANMNLTFFKNEKFMKALNGENPTVTSKEAFHNLVKVELSTEEP